jgi:hypothetical protein
VLAVAAVLGCAFLRAKGAADHLRADAAEHRAQEVAAQLRDTQQALTAERAKADALNAVAEQYEKDKRDAETAQERLVADLRTGNVRLRHLWQGCAARPVPGVAADPSVADAEDGLRFASAGRITGTVAACQAERDALLGIAEADRAQVKK